MALLTFGAAAFVASGMACTRRAPVGDPGVAADAPAHSTVHYVARAHEIDILFVLTVGNSTIELRRNAVAALPKLIETIEITAGAALSFRIGAVTSEVGAGPFQPPNCRPPAGALITNTPKSALCGSETSKPYLTLAANQTNVTGGAGSALERVKAALECRAFQSRCSPFGNVQLLEAGYLALTEAKNVDFLRPDALLLVVYVTDSLDCSLKNYALFDPKTRMQSAEFGPYTSFRCFEFGFDCDQKARGTAGRRTNCVERAGWLHPISRYASAYRALKPAGRVVLAGIGGSTDFASVALAPKTSPHLAGDDCYEGGSIPSLRLKALLERFPPLLFQVKCDLASSNRYLSFFERVGREAGRRAAVICAPRSASPSSCTVGLSASGQEQRLPACSADPRAPRCWTLSSEEACVASGQRIVLRGKTDANARVTIRCRSARQEDR